MRPRSLDLPGVRKQVSGSSPDSAMQHSFSSASSNGSDIKATRDDGYSSTSAASVSETRLKPFRVDLNCLSEEDSSPSLQKSLTLHRSASESQLVPQLSEVNRSGRQLSSGCLVCDLSPIPHDCAKVSFHHFRITL
jgi:hypothetical protein